MNEKRLSTCSQNVNMKRVFSESTVRIAAERVRQGIKSEHSVSEALSREDIERAWRTAYENSFQQNNLSKAKRVLLYSNYFVVKLPYTK